MGAIYRVRQFVSALRPSTDAEREASAIGILSVAEGALFNSLSSPYRRHSLAVYARVLANGCNDPVVLRAALLHDVGKSQARLRLHHRVLGVLLRRFALPVLLWLARPANPKSWRYPFHVQRYHAPIGSRLVMAAGGSAALSDLIARHHDPPLPEDCVALRLLRQADGAE